MLAMGDSTAVQGISGLDEQIFSVVMKFCGFNEAGRMQ